MKDREGNGEVGEVIRMRRSIRSNWGLCSINCHKSHETGLKDLLKQFQPDFPEVASFCIESISSPTISPIQIVQNIKHQNQLDHYEKRSFQDHQASSPGIKQIDQLNDDIKDEFPNMSENKANSSLPDYDRVVSDELKQVEVAHRAV